MARGVGAVLAGIVAALLALLAVTTIGGLVFPTSAELRWDDPTQIKAAFAALPLTLKLVIMVAWFAGGLAGAYVARWIAGARWAGWTVAGIVALYVALNVAVLPMPAWMQALSVAGPLAAAAIADMLPLRRRREPVIDEEEAGTL